MPHFPAFLVLPLKKKSPKSTSSPSSAAPSRPADRVLFICTGNYYRSRFAEALFNHYVHAAGGTARAFSRGLMTHLVFDDISSHTRHALLQRGIPLTRTAPSPVSLTAADLDSATHIVALKETEHRALIRARFPAQESRVEYWHVHDLDAATPEQTIAAIETKVAQLAQRLLAPPKSPPRPKSRKKNA